MAPAITPEGRENVLRDKRGDGSGCDDVENSTVASRQRQTDTPTFSQAVDRHREVVEGSEAEGETKVSHTRVTDAISGTPRSARTAANPDTGMGEATDSASGCVAEHNKDAIVVQRGPSPKSRRQMPSSASGKNNHTGVVAEDIGAVSGTQTVAAVNAVASDGGVLSECNSSEDALMWDGLSRATASHGSVLSPPAAAVATADVGMAAADVVASKTTRISKKQQNQRNRNSREETCGVVETGKPVTLAARSMPPEDNQVEKQGRRDSRPQERSAQPALPSAEDLSIDPTSGQSGCRANGTDIRRTASDGCRTRPDSLQTDKFYKEKELWPEQAGVNGMDSGNGVLRTGSDVAANEIDDNIARSVKPSDSREESSESASATGFEGLLGDDRGDNSSNGAKSASSYPSGGWDERARVVTTGRELNSLGGRGSTGKDSESVSIFGSSTLSRHTAEERGATGGGGSSSSVSSGERQNGAPNTSRDGGAAIINTAPPRDRDGFSTGTNESGIARTNDTHIANHVERGELSAQHNGDMNQRSGITSREEVEFDHHTHQIVGRDSMDVRDDVGSVTSGKISVRNGRRGPSGGSRAGVEAVVGDPTRGNDSVSDGDEYASDFASQVPIRFSR